MKKVSKKFANVEILRTFAPAIERESFERHIEILVR